MSKSEFLKILKESLEGSLDTNEIYSQLNYYEKYINDEINKGNAEEEVINQLGDPRLLAKTIKQVNQNDSDVINSDNYSYNDYSNDDYNNYQNSNDTYSTNNSRPFFYTSNNFTVGCIILMLVILIVLIGLLQFFGRLVVGTLELATYSPILFLFIVIGIYYLFKSRR